MQQPIAFIINPKSGVNRKKRIEKAVATYLDKNKFQPKFFYTEKVNDGARLALQACEEGIKTIIAVGGDGSVNDVVNGVYNKDVTIGIIPQGSGNGLSRTLKIPFDLPKAIEIINQYQTQLIDIGFANEKPFVSNIGVGFDCDVATAFAHSKKRGLKVYAWLSTKLFWNYKPKKWKLFYDNKYQRNHYFLLNVCNIQQFGYNFYTAPQADVNDGLLHILRIKNFPKLLGLNLAIYAFLKQTNRFPYTKIRSTEEVTISREEGQSFIYQADGDMKEEVKELKVSIRKELIPFIIP